MVDVIVLCEFRNEGCVDERIGRIDLSDCIDHRPAAALKCAIAADF